MRSPAGAVTVLLVDDHPAICDGAAMMLEQDGRFSFLMKAHSLDSALAAIGKRTPDLIVLDFVLGGRDGVEAIKTLRQESPRSKILVFSAYPKNLFGPICRQAGAAGYLVKTDRLERLPDRLWSLLLSNESHQERQEEEAVPKAWSGLSLLGAREMQVFVRIGEGKTTSEIAQELHLSEKTVFSHKENIKQKLGLVDSHKLMRLAITFSLSQGSAGIYAG